MTKVTIDGFKTPEQAMEFLNWYEGGGEQYFYDHLDIVGKTPDDGCNIDVRHKGNHLCYDVDEEGNVTAYVTTHD